MFHCNGWCFPWTITALAGTHICLRTISAKNIYESITKHNVTHMCGAPIILSMIINAEKNEIIEIKNKVNIMTAAAAPPPAILAEIEKKGITLRQRLVQHQEKESCVSCHKKIDPLGFALENFDAVGRWRDSYRSGLKIDASGQIFGKEKFNDVVGLKKNLTDNPEWFMRSFIEHILSYALGRDLNIKDKPHVDNMLLLL